MGAIYIKRVTELIASGAVTQNQGLYMLQQAEVIPQNLPEPNQPQADDGISKGGEEDGQD